MFLIFLLCSVTILPFSAASKTYAPVIKTKTLPKAKASGKTYTARLLLTRGTEPVSWTLDGELPEGFVFTEQVINGKTVHVITGKTDYSGTYPLTLRAANAIGNDECQYILQVDAVKPQIVIPKGFSRSYKVRKGSSFTIDLSGLSFTGTKPIELDIDQTAKDYGLTLNTDSMTLTGNIDNPPKNGKISFKLEAHNPYTQTKDKPVTLALTLTVKSAPDGLTPQNSPESSDEVPYYGTVGKKYTAKFRASIGEKPIKWKYEVINAGNITGYWMSAISSQPVRQNDTIEHFADGSISWNGLTFSRSGTISGKPDHTSIIDFRAIAYNDYGAVSSDVFTINCGEAPVLKAKNSDVVTIPSSGDIVVSLNTYFNFNHSYDRTPKPEFLPTDYAPRYYPKTEWSVLSGLPDGLKIECTDKNLVVTHPFTPTDFDSGITLIDGGPSTVDIRRSYITGTVSPANVKAGVKYRVKIRASNVYGSSEGTITLMVRDMPELDSLEVPYYAAVGRNYSAKLTARTGTKPIKWKFVRISVDKTAGTLTDWNGLKFNSNVGTIRGKPEAEGTITFRAYAYNSAGETWSNYTIDCGYAPEFTGNGRNTIILSASGDVSVVLNSEYFSSPYDYYDGINGWLNLDGSTEAPKRTVWSLQNNSLPPGLSLNTYRYSGDYPTLMRFDDPDRTLIDSINSSLPANVGMSPPLYRPYTRYHGIIEGTLNITEKKYLKKYPLTVIASNVYGSTKGKIILDVRDLPKIDPDGTLSTNLTAEDDKDYKLVIPVKAQKSYSLKLYYNSELVIKKIGDSGLTWNSSAGTITGSAGSMKAGIYSLRVVLTDNQGSDEKAFTLTIQGDTPLIINPVFPVINPIIVYSLPDAESEDIDENAQPEPQGMKIIRERDIESLDSGTLCVVSNDEYMIAAVLPAVSVDKSGTYDFDVTLSDDVRTGATLFWFAFAEPEASEDEETAEFYDETGAEISVVPESHCVTLSVWLNKGKTYAPVIVVKR